MPAVSVPSCVCGGLSPVMNVNPDESLPHTWQARATQDQKKVGGCTAFAESLLLVRLCARALAKGVSCTRSPGHPYFIELTQAQQHCRIQSDTDGVRRYLLHSVLTP